MYSLALGSTTSIMVELVKETEIFHWQKQIPHELSGKEINIHMKFFIEAYSCN